MQLQNLLMEFSYRLLANPVGEIQQFHGVGQRMALRSLLTLLIKLKEQTYASGGRLTNLKKQIIKYKNCQNISLIYRICLSQLTIDSLIKKVENDQVDELIFSVSAFVEENATNFYIDKLLKKSSVKLTRIIYGFTKGDYLEFADQITLDRSITHGVAFENSLKRD